MLGIYINLTSFFLRQNNSLDLEFTNSVRELASNPQESFGLCLVKAGQQEYEGLRI